MYPPHDTSCQVCFVHRTASSVCWLHPQADTSLGDTKAEDILDFVFSSTPSRKREITPSGIPTEDGGSFFPEALANISSNLIGLNQTICPPRANHHGQVMGTPISLSVAGHPWELDIDLPVRERGGSKERAVPARQNVGGGRRRGKWKLGRQPMYVYYINLIIIVIKAKLEAMQIEIKKTSLQHPNQPASR